MHYEMMDRLGIGKYKEWEYWNDGIMEKKWLQVTGKQVLNLQHPKTGLQ